MDLSVAIMAKNEEKNIRRLLESLEPLKKKIDMEIIIVDTGSTDNTIYIAKEYTDRVYEHKWNNDFAEMRNISLSYCTGKWILVLDADEELKEYSDLIKIVKDKKYNEVDIYQLICRSYIDFECKNYVDNNVPRLIRHGIKYEGKIHELPQITNNIINTNIKIYHYGYIKEDCRLMVNKFERNMKYLLENRKNNIDLDNTNYHIYNLYSMFGMFNKAIAEVKSQHYKSDNYIIDIRYGIELFKVQEYIKAIKVLEEVNAKINSKIINIDINYFLGASYYYMNDYIHAKEHLKKYLENYDINNYVEIYSINKKEEVKRLLCISLYYLEKYKSLIEVYEQIEDENESVKIKDIYVYALLKCNKLRGYYKKTKLEDIDIELITRSIERYNYVEPGSWIDLAKSMLGINEKLDYIINMLYLNKETNYNLCEINFDNFYEWKGKLLKELVKKQYNILFELSSLPEELINKYVVYLLDDNYCLINLYELSMNNVLEISAEKLKVLTIIEKNILLYHNVDFNDYDNLIYRAAINSIRYTLSKYNEEYIKDNLDNIDKYEAIWFKLRDMVKCISKKEYMMKLKDIVEENIEYARMLKEFNLKDTGIISDEMILEKGKILNEVKNLVSLGNIKDSLEVLKELLTIFSYDEEVLMNIGVVYYIIGNIDEAMRYLIKAYFVNSNNADICYNLGCVLEAKGYTDKSKYLFERRL